MTDQTSSTEVVYHNPEFMARIAGDWFTDALKQHCALHPDQTDGWIEFFQSGKARVHVTIELMPEAEIRCGYQIEGRDVVFHRVPVHPRPGPAS